MYKIHHRFKTDAAQFNFEVNGTSLFKRIEVPSNIIFMHHPSVKSEHKHKIRLKSLYSQYVMYFNRTANDLNINEIAGVVA